MDEKQKTYLIKPTFQLKFSLLMTSLIFIITLIYPLVIYHTLGDLILAAQKSFPQISESLLKKKVLLGKVLILWEIGFLGVIFTVFYFFAHKLAGSLNKLSFFFHQIKEGKGRGKISVNENEYFYELAQTVDEAFDYLGKEYRSDLIYLNDLIGLLNNLKISLPKEKRASLDKIISKLVDMQVRLCMK